jgi:hypothetical protein
MEAPIKGVRHQKGIPASRSIEHRELWEPIWDRSSKKATVEQGIKVQEQDGIEKSRFLSGFITARRGESDRIAPNDGGDGGEAHRPSTAAYMPSIANLSLGALSRGDRAACNPARKELGVMSLDVPEPAAPSASDPAQRPRRLDSIVQQIRAKFVLDAITPLDALAPFQHFDREGAGFVAPRAARLCLLELGLRLSPELLDEIARRAARLAPDRRPRAADGAEAASEAASTDRGGSRAL